MSISIRANSSRLTCPVAYFFASRRTLLSRAWSIGSCILTTSVRGLCADVQAFELRQDARVGAQPCESLREAALGGVDAAGFVFGKRADVLTDKQSNGGSEAAALAVLTCHSIDQHLPRGSGLRVLNVRALLRSSSFPEVRCRAGDSYRRSRPQRMPGKRRLEVRRLCDRWRDRERPYRLGARSTRPSAGTSARSQRGLRLFGGEGVYRITSNGAGLRANVCAWPPSRPSSRKEGNAGHPLAKTTSVARPLRRNYSLYSRHTSFDSGSSLSSALASLHVG